LSEVLQQHLLHSRDLRVFFSVIQRIMQHLYGPTQLRSLRQRPFRLALTRRPIIPGFPQPV
jgi:hypothetical protein